MKKNRLFIEYDSGDGSVSRYDLYVSKNEPNNQHMVMKYNENDESWTDLVRGEVAAKLKDNGNGVKIKLRNRKQIKLDYSELSELLVLLSYYSFDSGIDNFVPTIRKYKELDEEGC